MRRAGRIDANQTHVVDILRFIGASVAITSGAGNGLPDLLVGWFGQTYLLEVKDGARKPSERRLTPDERYFVEHWKGHPIAVVESEIEAIQALGFSKHGAHLIYADFVRPKRGTAKEKP